MSEWVPSGRPSLEQIGPRLRAIRKKRGWTLEALSQRAGMSMSTLSRLESGKRQPNLELLLPLSRLLEVTLDELVHMETTPDPRVRRAAIRRDGIVVVPLAPEQSPIHTYRVSFPPGRALPALKVHEGHEWLYVLSGRLRLRLGEQDLVLEHGEAAEFDTRTPHAMSAEGSRPAVILSIFNEAGMRMHTHSTTR